MKASLLGVGLIASSLFAACAADSAVEDPENDAFLTDDAKADAFGVEDWSPDGAAVLKLVSSASSAQLEDDVGLSARVAKSIVAKRATLPNGKYTDLAELDAASYVGKTVFNQLLRYAADHHLFKTALRIPLVVETDTPVSITTYNAKARAVGLAGFARYTFVDASTDYSKKMDSYDTRLQELATKAGITIEGEMRRYASAVSDYAVGSLKPCFIGDPEQVPEVPASLGDDLMGDMYIQWGWRYRTKKWIYEGETEADLNFGADWDSWNPSSKSVLLMSTNSDSGDNPEADVIPPCR
jgi:hypothetical protein